MLGLRSALKYILPELPEWLAAEIARAEHCRREMQCKGPSPRATPPSPPSSTSMSHEQSTPDMFDKNEHITRYEEAITIECHKMCNEFFNSNDSDDIVFERMTPSSPKRFDESFSLHHHRMSRGSADHSYHVRDDGTPDSPISQVIFVVYFNYSPSPACIMKYIFIEKTFPLFSFTN